MQVNSKHNEGVAETSPDVVVSARSVDGLIEAIEIPDKTFAIGLQWHQEEFWDKPHPGHAILKAFVEACIKKTRTQL